MPQTDSKVTPGWNVWVYMYSGKQGKKEKWKKKESGKIWKTKANDTHKNIYNLRNKKLIFYTQKSLKLGKRPKQFIFRWG